ncbi:MAG: chromate transporter [Prevotellaceae bacterium]|nr:chromate transporter [Candidatus Faecinaster equi]
MIFLKLFITFFKIGLVAFGGGYAVLSMIQGEVVTANHWLTSSEIADVIAISQMTPGPIGVNCATYVGYSAVEACGYGTGMCILGSCVATIAEILPSFIIMIAVIKIIMKYRHHPALENMFSLLRPTIVGLIAAAALILMTPENFGSLSQSPWQFYVSIFIFVASFIGIMYFKISPIRMIVLSAIAGVALFL